MEAAPASDSASEADPQEARKVGRLKTILVTGGAGFVGSHACKALSRAGYLPVTFDNLERGHERAVKWGPLERGDLRNDKDLARAFEAHRPWAVMHFAAYAYVGESSAECGRRMILPNSVADGETGAMGVRSKVMHSHCGFS
jgi:nucleoside-diphosphate-sugar epimerase